MLSILLTIVLLEIDNAQVTKTSNPTYNVIAFSTEDVKKKKKGFFSKVFGSK